MLAFFLYKNICPSPELHDVRRRGEGKVHYLVYFHRLNEICCC
jgi:hypothetical protein